MKHILNEISLEEKKRILEQHSGGKKLVIENFNKLVNNKLGTVKPLVSEQTTDSTCDGTFDELKSKTETSSTWTLTKINGEWSLSSGEFCTKDITIYGATQSLRDGSTTNVVKVDNTKNKVYFDGFNVGSKSNQTSNSTEESTIEGCPSIAGYEFFQNMFIQYPGARYKEIKLDTNKNVLSVSLSEDGKKILKEYKCQSPINFDTNQDLTTTIPDLSGYTDKLYIVSLTENKILSIRGGFNLNQQKPFTIQLN